MLQIYRIQIHLLRRPVAISCFGVRIVQHDYDRDTLVNDVAIIFLASDSAYPQISHPDLDDGMLPQR